MQAADGWGYPGARFPAITGGNAFSLFCQARSEIVGAALRGRPDGAPAGEAGQPRRVAPTKAEGEEYRWPVDPDLVHALATGTAYGLALHEWSADYSRNPTIYSREQKGKEPYLEVTLSDAAEPDPEPPTDLVAAFRDKHDFASLRLTLRAPKHGFAYEVAVEGKPLSRWNTPFVRPGETQVIPIRDLPRELLLGSNTVSVTTINRLGKRSAPATVRLPLWGPHGYDFPVITYLSGPGRPPQGLAVIPLEDKYDAAGKPVGDLPPDYQVRNEVFDSQTIRLAAARGEVVGFQTLIKGQGKIAVQCDLPGVRVEVYRAVYVQCEGGRRIPDPLVPLAPAEELALSADEATPVCVDVYVPFDFREREVKGALKLSDGRTLPILLAVRDFALPREASFMCEMNAYGLPDKTSEFYRIQQIAYDHRVHANILAYGHSSTAPGARKSNIDMVMDGPAGDGVRRMDEKHYNSIAPSARHGFWDDFALAFGPYLSGACFKGGWRGPVAAPGFYLTFHESWPLKAREFFSGDPDAYEAFKAKPVYAETFVAVLRDFLDRAAREGWGRAGFQVYLNNKGSLGDPNKAPWILDEPAGYFDYRALAYYADLVRQAKGEKCPVNVQYRIDISRPEFDRGQLWGKADLWVVSSSAFREYPRLVADQMERTGLKVWVYGTTNKVEESNRTVQAWVLDAYRGGVRGIVPWQTVSKDGAAMTKADQLGLFIFTKDAAGKPVIRHSMRLAAYRRAEQDVEYLELVRRRPGETDHSINLLISHYVNFSGAVRTAYAEDAGTPEYSKVTPESLAQVRAIAALDLAQP
jgi:hypothetical protein